MGFGSDTGTVSTYNYDGGFHLANQNQVQCIRREKGNCKICYAAVAYNDFALSGGTDFKFMTKSGKLLGKTVDNFCGLAGLATKSTVVVTANAAVADKMATLCTKRQPFRLQFQSDNFENSADEVSKGKLTQIGYNLAYTMSTC